VAGFTCTSAGRQSLHVCDNHAQSMRSAAVQQDSTTPVLGWISIEIRRPLAPISSRRNV
jgi:hypothetical protein